NYMAKTNDAVILGDASTRDITIVLPTPTSANKGKKYTIKKEDANEDGYVHVVGNISGVVSGLYTALPYSGWDLVSDGVSWRIVNKFYRAIHLVTYYNIVVGQFFMFYHS